MILIFSSILHLFRIYWFSPLSYLTLAILANDLPFIYHNRDSAGWNQRYRQKWWWKLRPGNIWPAVDEKDVVVLTDNNFSNFVAENQYVMINFYLHECKWCRKLAPEYAAAATMLKGKAVLAKIDSEERELAVKFNVDGWPTLYLLIGGGSHKILCDSNRTR